MSGVRFTRRIKMEVELVEIEKVAGRFQLIFYLSDGNKYYVDAHCPDYLTLDSRKEKEKREQREYEYIEACRKEDYRKSFYKKKGWKYTPKVIPEP
jgi:hypothetical protein